MTDDNSDTTVEQLKERIAELESHVYPSRRDVMAAAVGAVGISALTGTASAAPNYGNATGSVGTDSEPLNDVISKNGTFQSVSTDSATIEGHASELIFELDEYTFADETIDISVGQTWDILIFDVMETTTDGSSIEFYFNSASDSHNAITLSGSGSVSSNSASGPQTLVTMQNTDFNQFSGTYFAQSGISGSGGTRQFDSGDEWLLSGTNGQRSQTADLQIESTTADWSGTIYVGVGGGQL